MPILKDGTGTAIRIVGSDIYIDLDMVDGSFTLAELNTALSDATLVEGESFSTLAELNTIVTDATLVDAAHTHTASDVTNFRSSVGGYVDSIAGGSGFVNQSGAVALDLSTGRAFHHTMTGNITSLAFSNVPTSTVYSTSWTWVLAIDATGGYTLSSTPTVTWVDGNSFDDLDLTANAENVITFWQIGSTVYAAIVTNGSLSLEPYTMTFQEDGALLVAVSRAETLDLGNAQNLEADGTAGTGTLSFQKNGSTVSGSTAFAEGDVLKVTVASSTTPTAVSIPRFAA